MIIQKLQETICNGPHIAPFERGKSFSTSITPSLDDMPNAMKVRLSNLFTEKSSEYASFIAQYSLIFSACSRAYAINECKVLFIISFLSKTSLFWAQSIALDP